MTKFLAIDSGTHYTGWALYSNRRLLKAGLLEAPHKDWTHERLGYILDQVRDLIREHQPTLIVCEGWYGSRTPEISLLIKSLRKLTRLEHKEWKEYHSSTVVKCMHPEGKSSRVRARRKAIITEAVDRYYPKYRGENQDTKDAIAIGRTHLIQTGVIK